MNCFLHFSLEQVLVTYWRRGYDNCWDDTQATKFYNDDGGRHVEQLNANAREEMLPWSKWIVKDSDNGNKSSSVRLPSCVSKVIERAIEAAV